MPATWRHTIIFDDSLNMFWRVPPDSAASLDLRHNASVKGSVRSGLCTHAMRVSVPAHGAVRLHSDQPIKRSAQLSLQFWARGASSHFDGARCAASPSPSACTAPLCVSLARASSSAAPVLVPLCRLVALDQRKWSKVSVPLSAFGGAPSDAFDELALVAGGAGGGGPVALLLDEVVLVSSAPPPVPEAPSAGPKLGGGEAGACDYLSSEWRVPPPRGRRLLRRGGGKGGGGGGGGAARPLCRVEDGDHLDGRWVQNCAPSEIKRPDRYAYGRSLPRPFGAWDYRLCYKMSYAERERARAVLSYSWQPRRCALARVNGSAFSRWLGSRTLLLWGDSLIGQQFYSLVWLLKQHVVKIVDYATAEDALRGMEADRRAAARDGLGDDGSLCADSTVGNEGGALTVATLRGGGHIVKVLAHVEMIGQLRTFAPQTTWWAPLWSAADLIVFNVGHHFRNYDGSFNSYYKLVQDAAREALEHSKPGAWLVFKTSNVGHPECEVAAAPLAGGSEAAWSALGGRSWDPPTTTPEYFGKPRFDKAGKPLADKYDWRAPPLHESEWAKQFGYTALRHRFAYLNVSHVDARADGHVGAAMASHPDKAKSGMKPDCLHYCLPGPADAWASALYNLLLNNAKYAGAAPGPAG